MRILKLTKETKKNILNDLLKRSPAQYTQYEKTVADILSDVRERKDEAVFELTKRFDKWDATSSNIRVTEEEIKEAYTNESDITEWTREANENLMKYKIDDQVRRDIIQGSITYYLMSELNNRTSLETWIEKGGLR